MHRTRVVPLERLIVSYYANLPDIDLQRFLVHEMSGHSDRVGAQIWVTLILKGVSVVNDQEFTMTYTLKFDPSVSKEQMRHAIRHTCALMLLHELDECLLIDQKPVVTGPMEILHREGRLMFEETSLPGQIKDLPFVYGADSQRGILTKSG